MTAYSAGSLAGGFLAQRIARRTGRVGALLSGCAVQTGSLLLIGSVRHVAALVAGMVLLGAMNMVWNVNQVTLMQQRSPASMAGRIAAAFRTASVSGAPLGAFLGGAAAGLYGLNGPALLAAVLFASAGTALIPPRKRDIRVVTPDDDSHRGLIN
jgi:predicted MFS family arabinose efflux permease